MAESAEARKGRAARILTLLGRMYPDARIELDSSTPLELLVATILSAQCTDQRVNLVTAELFPRYRSAKDWAAIPPARLEREIYSTGFYKAKARAILGMAKALVERHGGEVPRTLEGLVALPGVGRKTASVVLGNAFGIPAFPVDTHVTRVSQRLGLTRKTEADDIHDDLCALIPRAKWTHASHLLIWHGRRTCHARAPKCPECGVRALCPWPGKTLPAGASAKTGRGRNVRKG
ncbi:MAG TPA: endonuclease III [Methylomirabilota bacterium]|nr:endonuclease III [Methylomirabilota bacterium]